MPTTEAVALLNRLATIKTSAAAYFAEADMRTLPIGNSWDVGGSADYYWRLISPTRQSQADSIASVLIDFANDASAAVRRSPLLGQADLLTVGHSIKRMRAALKLRNYKHWDLEVLHDEGTVLGVKPASHEEGAEHPAQATSTFLEAASAMAAVLELVAAGVDDASPVAIASSGLTAPAGYRPGTAFIMMSMQSGHAELEDVYDTVKRCFAKFGINALRADDIEHEDVITKRILDEIRTAEFLFADLSGERPSVYYEVGYAHALGRRVILFRRAGTVIHFDLAAYNCPEYVNLRVLEEQLTRRLEHVTGQAAERRATASAR
jgi:hypothetical protein